MRSLQSRTRSRSTSSHDGRRPGVAAWFRVPAGERLLAGAVMADIGGLMLVGGGLTDLLATMVITILTALLLIVASRSNLAATIRQTSTVAQIVLAGLIAIPLFQLVPLPPALWHHLPGQELRVTAFTLVGIADTWQPLSLTPADTIYTVLMSIAFSTLTLALMTLSGDSRMVVVRFIMAVILLGLLIGVIQVASGGAALRIHERASHGALLGFFSNKNHMALLLATSLPIMAVLTGTYDRHRKGPQWIFIGYWVIAVVGIAMTNSRAGVIFGMLATVAIAARMLRHQPRRYLIAGAIILLALTAFLLSLPQVDAVFNRFNSVGEDLRWRFAAQSVPLLRDYWLWGSGSGSFSRLYAVHENLLWVKPTFVNHLHDDYYQVAIEQGIAGVLLMVVAGTSVITGAVSAWRHRPEDRHTIFSAVIIVVLIALHSIVDYPLRRPAMFPVLAIALAIIWWRNDRHVGPNAKA